MISPSSVSDVQDMDDLYIGERNTGMKTRHWLSSKLPPVPMSYRDLRAVLTDQIPSNTVILPKSLSSSQTSQPTLLSKRQNNKHKQNPKQTGFDVYRSLVRSVSHYSTSSARHAADGNMEPFADSFTIARLSNADVVRPCNVWKTQKHETNSNNKARSVRTVEINPKPLSSSVDMLDRTASSNHYYEKKNSAMTTVATNSTRKELHVFVPQTTC